MKEIKPAALLGQLEEKLERQISFVIRHFQNMPEVELTAASATGGWSVAQCLEHLNTYGDYYLPLIRDRLQNGKAGTAEKTFKPGLMGDYFVKVTDPKTSTQKMKARKMHQPLPGDPHGIVARHLEQQERLLSYLGKARKLDLNRNKIPVSIMPAIRIKLGDALRFLLCHNDRHLRQAAAIHFQTSQELTGK